MAGRITITALWSNNRGVIIGVFVGDASVVALYIYMVVWQRGGN